MTLGAIQTPCRVYDCSTRIVGSSRAFNWCHYIWAWAIITLRTSKTHIIRYSCHITEITWWACKAVLDTRFNSFWIVSFERACNWILFQCTVVAFWTYELRDTSFQAIESLLAVLAITRLLSTPLEGGCPC